MATKQKPDPPVPGRAYDAREFWDAARANSLETVPGSAIWLPHPTQQGRSILAVQLAPKKEVSDA
ncbi:MAG: hypothetical protein KJ077_10905 [Anaerolineae bacterium]|nr:hypothetical protein [Anaerolineae bacterium]